MICRNSNNHNLGWRIEMAYEPKTVVEDDIPAESKGPKPKKGPKTVKPEAKTLFLVNAHLDGQTEAVLGLALTD